MLRFIFILAVLYGIFWCYNNFDYSTFKASTIEAFKKEKTIKIINKTRAELNKQCEEAME